VQNIDGAGGLTGTTWLGEIAPKDGTAMGYLTGAAWLYASEPERHRADLRSYEFVAYQPGTSIYYVRTDVSPGMKEATDIMKAKGLVSGGLAADNSKDLLMRLALDMLGVSYRHVTGYQFLLRIAARLSQRGGAESGQERASDPGALRSGLERREHRGAEAGGRAYGAAVPRALSQDQGRAAVGPAVGCLSRDACHQLGNAAFAGVAADHAAARA
jgi:hypothetical protein